MPPRRPRPARLGLTGTLTLAAGDTDLGGAGRVALLEALARDGSINAAARRVGLSYKAAWDAIDAMNALAAEPLVERVTGGRGGGGTRLTAYGRKLVDRYTQLAQVHARFVAALDRAGMDLDSPFSLSTVLTMRTSARNHWEGVVSALRGGAVNDEVEVTLAGGTRLLAIITRTSTVALGLRVHAPVIVLVKSSAVIVATGLGDARLSAENRLDGNVARIVPGAVNGEVAVVTAQGLEVVAIASHSALRGLDLAPGKAVSVLIKPSDVVLAVVT
ncbi:MAG: TOBE domain-containing protein [Proteobacteria bacterium]|nr:TOBE domain-containing protein [Pseudomonadota bacterium]